MPTDILTRLTHLIDAVRDPMERQNITRDLSLMCARIETHEYQNTDFMQRQSFDTLRRTHEFFNYLIGYHEQASRWAKILKQLPLKQLGSIMDLCPGAAPKIEWALQQCGFTGTLTILEKDPIACQQLRVISDILGFQYTVLQLQQDFFAQLPYRVNAITANHILDDLLLDHYCNQQAIPLREVYADETELRRAVTWLMTTDHTTALLDQIFEALDAKLDSHGYCVMAQYPGITERALNLTEWSAWLWARYLDCYQRLLDHHYTVINTHFEERGFSYFIIQKGA